MKDTECVEFLQRALPRLRLRWPGFRKVRKQVCKRVDRRIRELGLSDAAAYAEYLEQHAEEWSLLDAFCRIPISRFYRDRGVFEYLGTEILPLLVDAARRKGERVLRCWSAGCASGEEPYTLAILWRLALAPRYADVTIGLIATDSDPHMLSRAREGCYSASSLKDVPHEWLSLAFERSGDLYCVRPQCRACVELVEQDIRREMPEGTFHLVLCRHMAFTYFDAALQEDVLRQLIVRLVPGGILVTGKQEPLPTLPHELEECRSRLGVYRKRMGD